MRRGASAFLAGSVVLLWAAAAAAQAPEIDMRADRDTVAVGELFQLQIRVSVEGESPLQHIELPSLDAFAVEGRSISRPMQFSFGFGQGPVVRQTTSYTFDLRAVRVGSFTLAPVEAVAGGQRYRGRPHPGPVVGVGPQPGSQLQQGGPVLGTGQILGPCT